LVSRKGRDERIEKCLGVKVGDHERVENCIMWALSVRCVPRNESDSMEEHETVSKCSMVGKGNSKYNVLYWKYQGKTPVEKT